MVDSRTLGHRQMGQEQKQCYLDLILSSRDQTHGELTHPEPLTAEMDKEVVLLNVVVKP